MNRLTALIVILACLFLVTVPAQARLAEDAMPVRAPSATNRLPSTVTFSVDGVTLELTTSFLADPNFVASDPGSAIQAASSVERTPAFKAFSVTAAPFGTSPPTESLPVARPGGAQAYRDALRAYRDEQGGRPEEGAVMRLFGEEVVGMRSVVPLTIRDGDPVPVVITEWVVEAGSRLWIVRASREVGSEMSLAESASELTTGLSGAALWSSDPDQPSTSLAAAAIQDASLLVSDGGVSATGSDLPFPPWWQGECDAVHFQEETGERPFALGAEYRGLKACGPRPWADRGPEAVVYFGGGYGQREWQCPELSMRFLYLAYGITPYPANGSQVVENYSGDQLEKVWNCTEGRAPQPDDVLSTGATTTYGHTSVVVASNVDGSGNGWIDVIEQNSSSDGHNTLDVEGWCVGSANEIVRWLHKPGWSETYYSDDALGTQCARGGRDEMRLFEDWGEGAPAESCPPDDFSSRFWRYVPFESAGRWRFSLLGDDGARLWIDDELIVDAWESPSTWFTPTVTLSGTHELRVEHHDEEGEASVDLDWEHVSDAMTPTAWITSPVEGATFDACPVTLEAEVDDDLGPVDRVEFHAYYNQEWHHLGDDDAAPYEWEWDCQSVIARSAQLAVHVWDSEGSEYVDLGAGVSITLDHLEQVLLPLVLRSH